MPSLSTYRKMLGNYTNGEAHKMESDMVMEETWYDDMQTRTAYFYDYAHDTHPRQFTGLSPETDPYKVPISIKYIVEKSGAKNSKSIIAAIVRETNVILNALFFKCLSIFIPADRIKNATAACIPRKA